MTNKNKIADEARQISNRSSIEQSCLFLFIILISPYTRVQKYWTLNSFYNAWSYLLFWKKKLTAYNSNKA